MARPTYALRPQARLDALEIARYIARDNPRAADVFLAALEETCCGIAAMPLVGTRRSFAHPLLRDARMTPVRQFPSYLIFYRPLPRGADIIRIIHGARDLPVLFSWCGQTDDRPQPCAAGDISPP
jgi:toxin ParE1/3/4